jgi:CheY-like chemotaxis protein
MSTAPARILVVDDQAVNVRLLKSALQKQGLLVIPAYSGQQALDLVEQAPPELILLDVIMPEMDGLEVCRRLQEDGRYKNIPVIFVTGRSSKEGRLAGLRAGAVDYITKSIDLDETLARVRSQLRMLQLNRDMLDLQRRLVESRHAASIGAITQGIAHNLNNLLGVVIGYLELIKAKPDCPDRVLANAEKLDHALQRIVGIIRQLTTLVVKSRQPTTAGTLNEIIRKTLRRFAGLTPSACPVEVENPHGDLNIHTHVEMFEDALCKILVNAYESYGEGHTGPRPIHLCVTLRKSPRAEGRMVVLKIEDHGRGLDPQIRDHMFEPFISSKNTVGVGMGLTVARHCLRNLGGDLTLENRPGGGATATLIHPIDRRRRATPST